MHTNSQLLAWNDAEQPRDSRENPHKTIWWRVDGVAAAWRRVVAVDAKVKFGKGWKSR